MSDRHTAAIEWLALNPDYKDDVLEVLMSVKGILFCDAVNRVWRKVKHLGDAYKTDHVQFVTLVGDADYEGQGSLTVMWDKRKVDISRKDFLDNFLILRNPGRNK